MEKMSLFGVPGGKNALIDCTNVLPKATNSKRDMLAASPFSKKYGQDTAAY